MPKFRKKPVVIEAFQLTDVSFAAMPAPDWFVAALSAKTVFDLSDHFTIRTLEGDMRAEMGDWIIRGIRGELYPCKPDIFAATYEPAGDAAP